MSHLVKNSAFEGKKRGGSLPSACLVQRSCNFNSIVVVAVDGVFRSLFPEWIIVPTNSR